jgi:hypothetical protein
VVERLKISRFLTGLGARFGMTNLWLGARFGMRMKMRFQEVDHA